jgi:Zn-dependent protease
LAEDKQRRSRSRLTSWLVGLGVLLASLGSKLKFLLPLLKWGKFGSTIITMAISVWAYALAYSLEFSIGLVLMIFIHEMGHVWAAKRKGLPVSAPAFIPFLGALITLKRQPQDAVTEAYIAYGGPLLGTLGALACYGIGLWTGQEIFFVIAMIGFFINLFNLVPIHPLDGGRIVTAITRWLWIVGLILGVFLIIYLQSLLLAIIYIFFVIELWSSWRRRKGSNRPKTNTIQIGVDPSTFVNQGVWIPGEEHQRDLLFTQYSDLQTRETFAEIIYPGVGVIAKIPGIEGEIQKVKLVRTKHPEPGSPYLQMILEFTYFVSGVEAREKERRYYQVTPKQRVLFSIAYVGLIAFLIFMMMTVSKEIPPTAVIG